MLVVEAPSSVVLIMAAQVDQQSLSLECSAWSLCPFIFPSFLLSHPPQLSHGSNLQMPSVDVRSCLQLCWKLLENRAQAGGPRKASREGVMISRPFANCSL